MSSVSENSRVGLAKPEKKVTCQVMKCSLGLCFFPTGSATSIPSPVARAPRKPLLCEDGHGSSVSSQLPVFWVDGASHFSNHLDLLGSHQVPCTWQGCFLCQSCHLLGFCRKYRRKEDPGTFCYPELGTSSLFIFVVVVHVAWKGTSRLGQELRVLSQLVASVVSQCLKTSQLWVFPCQCDNLLWSRDFHSKALPSRSLCAYMCTYIHAGKIFIHIK